MGIFVVRVFYMHVSEMLGDGSTVVRVFYMHVSDMSGDGSTVVRVFYMHVSEVLGDGSTVVRVFYMYRSEDTIIRPDNCVELIYLKTFFFYFLHQRDLLFRLP